jgi:hypothetical protein
MEKGNWWEREIRKRDQSAFPGITARCRLAIYLILPYLGTLSREALAPASLC